MKKKWMVVLVVLLIVFIISLTACGTSTSEEIQKPSDVSINNDNNDETKTTELPNSAGEEKQETKGLAEETTPKTQEATITETVLVDEAGVKVTAKSLETGGIWGPEIKLLIENNSGKDLTFQSRNVSVNGYMVETMMSVDVVNGKKANDTLTIMDSSLEACGIETIADIEFSFSIFTTSDWEDYLNAPQLQLKTTAVDTYQYTFDDSGDVAYDGNGAKIVVKGLSEDDSIFGPGIIVYIENNGDKDITVQTEDVSINGFMIDAVFSSDVMVGKRAVDAITFFESDLEENGIEKIETVELSFHIFDFADWETIVDTDIVTITF